MLERKFGRGSLRLGFSQYSRRFMLNNFAQGPFQNFGRRNGDQYSGFHG